MKRLPTKAELKQEEDKIVELRVWDSSFLHGKSHFENDST